MRSITIPSVGNTANGDALFNNTTGNNNTADGSALRNNTTGISNTAIGDALARQHYRHR